MFRRTHDSRWSSAVVRVVAALIVFAGIAKALNLTEFEANIRQWNSIPAGIVPLVIVMVPLAEVAIGAMAMAVPRKVRSRFCLLALLIILTAAVVVEALMGGEIACNCFGPVSTQVELNTKSIVTRNFVLISIVAWSFFASLRQGAVCRKALATEEA